MKKIIYRLFFVAGLILSSLGLSTADVQATSSCDVQKNTLNVGQATFDKLNFSDIIKGQDSRNMSAWHSSHSSHSSHASHRSHYSSR